MRLIYTANYQALATSCPSILNHLAHLGTYLKIPSGPKSGSCIRSYWRTVISRSSFLWKVSRWENASRCSRSVLKMIVTEWNKWAPFNAVMTPNLIVRTCTRVSITHCSHYRHYRHCATHASLCSLLRTNYKETRLNKRKFLCFGAFAKLRKATISFVMSVCLSIRTEQLGSHWTDLQQVWYLSIFSKICLENSSFTKRGQE